MITTWLHGRFSFLILIEGDNLSLTNIKKAKMPRHEAKQTYDIRIV